MPIFIADRRRRDIFATLCVTPAAAACYATRASLPRRDAFAPRLRQAVHAAPIPPTYATPSARCRSAPPSQMRRRRDFSRHFATGVLPPQAPPSRHLRALLLH